MASKMLPKLIIAVIFAKYQQKKLEYVIER